MKLLILIHRLPCPPDRGAKLRASEELSYLARRHEVWCAGFIEAGGQADRRRIARDSLVNWRKICRAVAAVPLYRPLAGARAMHWLLAGATATEGYFASRRLERQVLRWAKDIRFDAVLAFSSSMAPLALRVPARTRVLDLVDLDSRKWAQMAETATWPLRWIYRTEGRRLARREQDWMAAFDASVLINEREAALLGDGGSSPKAATGPIGARPAVAGRRVHVIETGTCSEGHSIALQRRHATGADGALPEEANIGFIGAMDYPPNVEGACWFARLALPLIRARRPDAAFWIVGRSPTRAVRALDDGCSIHVTGTVPSIGPYLSRMRVSVAPLRLARGVQTKVLTAMAAGIPCVVTPCVAEGIGAQAGREILVAESPDRFARAVRALLDNRERAESVGAAGRRFVLQRFHPEAGLAKLEMLLQGSEMDSGHPLPNSAARSIFQRDDRPERSRALPEECLAGFAKWGSIS